MTSIVGAARPNAAVEAARRLVGPPAAWVWRHPWLPTVAVATLGWRVNSSGLDDLPVDWGYFAPAGEALWDGRLAQALSDPAVQAGPLTLALLGALARLVVHLPHPGAAAGWAMAAVAATVLTAAVRRTARPVSPARAGAGLLLAWCAAVLWGPVSGVWAHPSHSLVPFLWLLAVLDAQAGRGRRAGLWLGLSVGLDTWGLMGAAALLPLLPSRRALLRAAAVAAGVAALVWLPLLVAGPVRSGEHVWPVGAGSLPTLVGWSSVGAPWRVAQLAAAVVVGAVVARSRLRSPDLAWLLPAVVVCVRLVTEVQYFDYYTVPVTLSLLVGTAVMVARRDRRTWLLLLATAVACLRPATGSVLLGVLPLVAAAVIACRTVPAADGSSTDGQPSSETTARSASR